MRCHMSCDDDGLCVYGKERPLTFAEAMAMDPKDAEVCFDEDWYLLREIADSHTLATFRCAKFRPARPKRSRVQEMCERDWGGVVPQEQALAEGAMREAIRAVCEYVRSLKLGYRDHDDEVAGRIEREFLERR